MIALGIEFEESERTEICADIFGAQVGSQFQEGIIDADDEKELRVGVVQLQEVWETRSGVKGREFHLWFQRYKLTLSQTSAPKSLFCGQALYNESCRMCQQHAQWRDRSPTTPAARVCCENAATLRTTKKKRAVGCHK